MSTESYLCGAVDAGLRIRREQFVLVAPRAASVALVGDFNDWDPGRTPLHPAATGVWSVNVPLQPGQHQYAFVVDGKDWRPDPAAPAEALRRVTFSS